MKIEVNTFNGIYNMNKCLNTRDLENELAFWLLRSSDKTYEQQIGEMMFDYKYDAMPSSTGIYFYGRHVKACFEL